MHCSCVTVRKTISNCCFGKLLVAQVQRFTTLRFFARRVGCIQFRTTFRVLSGSSLLFGDSR